MNVRLILCAIVFGSTVFSCPQARSQTDPRLGLGEGTGIDKTPAGVEGFKGLTLDDLMNIDVTSVSRQPEAYKNAPAALRVITQDEIRRSGASSLPEALRLADNLQVA